MSKSTEMSIITDKIFIFWISILGNSNLMKKIISYFLLFQMIFDLINVDEIFDY